MKLIQYLKDNLNPRKGVKIMKVLHGVAFILVIIGGLNWGLSAFDFNVVDKIFGMGSAIAKIVYVLVGLSAIYLVAEHKSTCKHCENKSAQPAM